MTPYQQALIKAAQTVFITLLLTGIVLSFIRPLFVEPEIEITECRMVDYPVRWTCMTQKITITALNKLNEQAQRERDSR